MHNSKRTYIEKVTCFVTYNSYNKLNLSSNLAQWLATFSGPNLKIIDKHEKFIGRLIPILLCGEQSAQLIFDHEVKRLEKNAYKETIKTFSEIELDEYGHDLALKHMQCLIPVSSDFKSIKRKAKIFFAGLGRDKDIKSHFIQISKLDSSVCKIMQSIIHSDLPRDHPFSLLCEIIKSDEAKHVSLGYHHEKCIGASKKDFQIENEIISKKLIKFLSTEANSFEGLGIDPDKLFKKLELPNGSNIYKS